MIKEITSIHNEIVKYACSLKNNSDIKKEKRFLIEGEHLLEMSKLYLETVFTTKKLKLDDSINQYIVNKEILKKISSSISVPDVIGLCRFIDSKIDYTKPILYLDAIQDPGNVGTIIRTALAFKFRNIILSTDSSYLYNQKVIQSSQGAIFEVNIESGDIGTIKLLKEKYKYKIFGTSLSTVSKNLDNVVLDNNKFVIIFGNEGNGIKKEIENLCDLLIKIEISSSIDSLNVGVAAGIILYKIAQNID